MKAKAEKSMEEVVSNDVGEGSEQELDSGYHVTNEKTAARRRGRPTNMRHRIFAHPAAKPART